jgi:hypothetical protein
MRFERPVYNRCHSAVHVTLLGHNSFNTCDKTLPLQQWRLLDVAQNTVLLRYSARMKGSVTASVV